MENSVYPKEFTELLKTIKGKRAKFVVDTILAKGIITTEEIAKAGYLHPPRAIRDVKDRGVPIKTVFVKNSNGKSIAAYTFGGFSETRDEVLKGRTSISPSFKAELVSGYGENCEVCTTEYPSRHLQKDHRVPYEVAGDRKGNKKIEDFMLLCRSCNRQKSGACEGCPNWKEERDPEVCRSCYWSNPKDYNHIALREIESLELNFSTEEDIQLFNTLNKQANGVPIQELIKGILQTKITEQ